MKCYNFCGSDQNLEYNAPTVLILRQELKHYTTGDYVALTVKSYVMGRKNFLFHDTVKGATASAIVYTLAETAKINGLNIRLYLETVMTKMLDYKNEPESILEDLMPWSEMMHETCSLNNHSEI